MDFSANIANLGKYNAGVLAAAWLSFPATTEQVQSVLREIGVDGLRYEEVIILESLAPSFSWKLLTAITAMKSPPRPAAPWSCALPPAATGSRSSLSRSPTASAMNPRKPSA